MLTEAAPGGVLRRVVRLLDTAATPHGVDRYIELVAPTWSTTEVRGRVVAVRRQTAGTATLTIEANRNWRGHEAGQYTQLTVEVNGVRHTRCYSVATSASGSNRLFELTVKAHPGGVVSNHLVRHSAAGMVVGLSPAQGSFVLPDTRPSRVLLLSGGSGITPVISMLRTLCDEAYEGCVTFVHYCPTPEDLTYSVELAELAAAHPNVRVLKGFTDAHGRGDLDGFVSLSQLDAADAEWRSADTFVCGPAPLMDAVSRLFDEQQISEQLHTETFTVAHWAAEAGSVDGTLRFADSKLSIDNDGRTILEQAEGAGLRPANGCRMGICATCSSPLVNGAVRNVVTGKVTSSDGGDVRICVNSPLGDIEIGL